MHVRKALKMSLSTCLLKKIVPLKKLRVKVLQQNLFSLYTMLDNLSPCLNDSLSLESSPEISWSRSLTIV